MKQTQQRAATRDGIEAARPDPEELDEAEQELEDGDLTDEEIINEDDEDLEDDADGSPTR
jgi:hypothetical protein